MIFLSSEVHFALPILDEDVGVGEKLTPMSKSNFMPLIEVISSMLHSHVTSMSGKCTPVASIKQSCPS